MHLNAFGGRAPPGPAEGTYSAPLDLLAGLKGEGRYRGEEGGRGNWGRRKGEGPPCLKCVDSPEQELQDPRIL